MVCSSFRSMPDHQRTPLHRWCCRDPFWRIRLVCVHLQVSLLPLPRLSSSCAVTSADTRIIFLCHSYLDLSGVQETVVYCIYASGSGRLATSAAQGPNQSTDVDLCALQVSLNVREGRVGQREGPGVKSGRSRAVKPWNAVGKRGQTRRSFLSSRFAVFAGTRRNISCPVRSATIASISIATCPDADILLSHLVRSPCCAFCRLVFARA